MTNPPFSNHLNTGDSAPVSRAGNQDWANDPPVKGWICPVCEHGVAPTEKLCPCVVDKDDDSNRVWRCTTCGKFNKGYGLCGCMQITTYPTITTTPTIWSLRTFPPDDGQQQLF